MIAYFAADLLWATRIKGCAEDMGIPARPVRSPEMLGARLADSDVRALVVDLDSPETALALIRHLREYEAQGGGRRVRIVAFGPHVGVEALNAASAAGADKVLARGAFSAHMPALLRWSETGEKAE